MDCCVERDKALLYGLDVINLTSNSRAMDCCVERDKALLYQPLQIAGPLRDKAVINYFK